MDLRNLGALLFSSTPLSAGPKFMSDSLPIFEEQIRIYNAKRLWVFHEKPSKHLTVISPETVNIKKLANLTANSKKYGQITLNAKPHSVYSCFDNVCRLKRTRQCRMALWVIPVTVA